MEQYELLQKVAEALENLSVPYFVTGSMVTIYFGEPRFTNDIDFVADLRSAHVEAFCRRFPPPEYYVSETAVQEALQHRSQFNIIHAESGLKVDIMIPRDDAFNRSRFARKLRVSLAPGLEADFCSTEDVILKKLESYRDGGDIRGVLRISGHLLDESYIEDWADRLGLQGLWRQVKQ
jgi:hypothetical protein